MTTIKDLAKESQLSLGTISNYLNGKEILPKNAEKIETAIKKLNYIPNKFGRHLRNPNTKTIGIITNKISASYISKITSDFEHEFSQKGYEVLFCNSNENTEMEKNKLRFLIGNAVNTIILFPVYYKESDISEFENSEIPIILCDQLVEKGGDNKFAVVNDNVQMARELTKMLIDEGHTQISCIAGNANHYSTVTRIEGYKQALEAAGLPFDEKNVYYCDSQNELSYEATTKIINSSSHCTAVLITVNNMLLGFLKAVDNAGLRICKDISYATFSYEDYYSILPQRPTYVSHNTLAISRVLTELVEKMVFSPDSVGTPKIIYTKSDIIIGDSHKKL